MSGHAFPDPDYLYHRGRRGDPAGETGSRSEETGGDLYRTDIDRASCYCVGERIDCLRTRQVFRVTAERNYDIGRGMGAGQ